MDSAWSAMMKALRSDAAPGLYVLRYDRTTLRVSDLVLVPRLFLHELAIEKRRPLGPNARRAGWVGCNILLDRIPPDGVIPVVRDQRATGALHPRNRHVRDKIRQQLQVLRDMGVLEFVRPGRYRIRGPAGPGTREKGA